MVKKEEVFQEKNVYVVKAEENLPEEEAQQQVKVEANI